MEWKTCYMKFEEVEFEKQKPGKLIWRNIPGVESDNVLGPLTVKDNKTVVNSSGVEIPVELFGPNIIWYVPVL